MKITKHFKDFFKSESSSGIILILITLLTIITVNFVLHENYLGFWKTELAGKPLDFWINDVLIIRVRTNALPLPKYFLTITITG